jgi:hypothetical protein
MNALQRSSTVSLEVTMPAAVPCPSDKPNDFLRPGGIGEEDQGITETRRGSHEARAHTDGSTGHAGGTPSSIRY